MALPRAVLSALAAVALGAAPAAASPMVQLEGAGGCLTVGGAGGCGASGVLTSPTALLVTDNTAYVTALSVGAGQGPGVALFDRNATTGVLTRRPGPAGCVSETGDNTAGGCTDGHALATDSGLGPAGIAISPDGTRLYVASPGSDAVVVLGRNPSTGNLAQATDATGCISQTGAGPCNDGRGLVDLSRLAVSPDGASLYAAGAGVSGGGTAGGVAWMKPGASGLTQETNQAACFQQAADAECTAFPSAGMYNAGTGIVVSPDGEHVYAGSFTSGSVITFDRTPASGALTQTGCLRGSANANCTTAPELLNEISGMRFASPTQLWVAVRNKDNAFQTGRFQRLDRNPATGAVTIGNGCVSAPELSDLCAKSPYLFTANDIVFSPDGKSAFAASHLRRTVHSFDRSGDGRLTNVVPSTGGCVTAWTIDAACAVLRGVDNAFVVEVSPDGRFVYGAGQAGFDAQVDGLTVFRRDTGPPSCPDQSASVAAGGAIRISLTCTEPDGEPLTRTLVEAPAYGVLGGIDQVGAFVDYAPGGQSGAPTLKFKATANGVDSNVATVTINVSGGTPSPAPTTTPTPTPGPAPTPTPTPTAPARISSPVRASFIVFRNRYTRFTRLQVVEVPAAATVTILCTGKRKGCPFKKRTFRPSKGRVDATKAVRRAKLRRGASVEVRITRPGAIGRSVTFAINGRTVPGGRRRCLAVGSTAPVKC